MSKPRVIKDYEKLDPKIQEMVKLVYPEGYEEHLIPFNNAAGQRKLGLPFETEDYYYLIRMSREEAREIIEEDDDFMDGSLRNSVRNKFAEKYDDVEFLTEFNANEDNEFDELEPGEDNDF